MYLQFKKRQYTYLDELRVITSNYNYYIYNVYCNLTRSTHYLEHFILRYTLVSGLHCKSSVSTWSFGICCANEIWWVRHWNIVQLPPPTCHLILILCGLLAWDCLQAEWHSCHFTDSVGTLMGLTDKITIFQVQNLDFLKKKWISEWTQS